jgi:hypothetical protein
MSAKVAPEETKDDKSSSPKPKNGAEEWSQDAPKRKINRKDKNYYLLIAQTENYVDDSDLYKSRANREMRMEYWEKMMDQGKSRRKPPKDFMTYQEAWMTGDFDVEGLTYPTLFVWQQALVRTSLWDYLSLFLFLLYTVVIIAVYDGLGAGLIPLGNSTINSDISVGNLDPETAANAAAIGLSPATMLLPLIFMFLLQVPPTLGSFYFITRCNDLVKYKARKTKFGSWSFTNIFISQAVEYFMYGGADNVKGAGTCAYGGKMMELFGKKEVVIGDLDTIYDREYPSDDDEEFVDDQYPEGHVTIQDRITKARIDLEENPDDEDLQQLVQGELEVSFLQKILNEKRKAEEEAHALAKAEAAAREATCKEWTTWMCMVCRKPNRRPTHPPSVTDIFFGEKGVFYKRIFAIIRPRRDAPSCHFCGTYADYKPPLCSAHTFPYNKDPYRAFKSYPIKTTVQAGLSNTLYSRVYNSVYSFLYGIRNNSDSALVYNDWRLRLYLNGRFPETPRQVKPTTDLYQEGEYVECRLQKSEWSRAIVTKSRANHTYDLRYDPGDELRLIDERHIRLPPEKRAYAYYVELTMVFLWLSFPIGVIASQAIAPGLITFFPFVASSSLLFMRLSKLLKYVREYKFAGLWPIVKLSMFYTLPLLFMVLGSFMPFLEASWVTVSYFWIGTKVISLPVLYVMKPNFAVFGAILFVQTSAGMYMLGSYCDGNPVVTEMMAVHMAPICTATLTLLYIRKNFNALVDVHLTIRPPLNFIKPENPCLRLYHMFVKDPNAASEAVELTKEEMAAKAAEEEKALEEIGKKLAAEAAAEASLVLNKDTPKANEEVAAGPTNV